MHQVDQFTRGVFVFAACHARKQVRKHQSPGARIEDKLECPFMVPSHREDRPALNGASRDQSPKQSLFGVFAKHKRHSRDGRGGFPSSGQERQRSAPDWCGCPEDRESAK